VARRPWPGNVRELRNFAERVVALGPARALAIGEAQHSSMPSPTLDGSLDRAFHKPFRDFQDDVEREYLRRLLERHGGNVISAATEAGLNRTYIYRLARKHRL
jgi:DNA-binding NtrC family response regulator